MDGLNVGDVALRKSRLLSRQCGTCIFRAGDPMRLGPGRLKELVDTALERGSYIICHDTLPVSPAARRADVQPAICRGFKDRYRTPDLQVMERLWGFVEVDPPGE